MSLAPCNVGVSHMEVIALQVIFWVWGFFGHSSLLINSCTMRPLFHLSGVIESKRNTITERTIYTWNQTHEIHRADERFDRKYVETSARIIPKEKITGSIHLSSIPVPNLSLDKQSNTIE